MLELGGIIGNGKLSLLNDVLTELEVSKLLFVHGKSYSKLQLDDLLDLKVDYVEFTEFTPNPDVVDINKGLDIFLKENCDAILVIGGGSAIDVAKTIKLYSGKDIPLIASPTTAGSGSEVTRYAAVYKDGVKQSLTDDKMIPDFYILDGNTIKSLPIYHKKASLMDALCQAIESMWSVNSNDISKGYSKDAIQEIMSLYKLYIYDNDFDVYPRIMAAANLAGKAISITQTTSAHAMSYKLTTMYGIAHGHAVMSCIPYIWDYMIDNLDKCIDPRGRDYVQGVFDEIADLLEVNTPKDAAEFLRRLYNELELDKPSTINENDINELASSVNLTRLRNNPVELDEEALTMLYRKIVTIK